MFLKAGLLSLMLLLASRVLGVLRETALAAALGSSGMADVVIVMLTLPDWLAGVLVSGALAYVLLPHWAKESAAQQNASQGRVARRLMLMSIALAAVMCIAQVPLSALLVPGVSASLQSAASEAVVWSALAMPELPKAVARAVSRSTPSTRLASSNISENRPALKNMQQIINAQQDTNAPGQRQKTKITGFGPKQRL